MNPKQTQALNAHFKNRAWEHYGGVLGAAWIVCGSVSYYVFFDKDFKITKVLVD